MVSTTAVVPAEMSGPRLFVVVAVDVATLTLMSGGSSKLTPTDLHMVWVKPRVTVFDVGRVVREVVGLGGEKRGGAPCWSETLHVCAIWDWRDPINAGVQKQWTSMSVQPAAVMADSVTFCYARPHC